MNHGPPKHYRVKVYLKVIQKSNNISRIFVPFIIIIIIFIFFIKSDVAYKRKMLGVPPLCSPSPT
jgi:hypothetical protein